MYISDTEDNSRAAGKTAFCYLLASLFCLLFGVAYEYFSHEVYSAHMIYAFAVPLTGGTLPFLAVSLFCERIYPRALARSLYHAGLSAFTVGSIVKGVLEIYGTTNRLVYVYGTAGGILAAAGLLLWFPQALSEIKKK